LSQDKSVTRRNFLYITTGTFAAAGSASLAWPFIDQMNPDASVKALASTEVDLTPILPGQSITILWRGKPVFIRRRTSEEIAEANQVKLDDLPDPQNDEDRVQNPEWLIMVGVCTHLGCIPLGQKGDYNGWFCPCHGSHYDTSGRIRKGPAPKNLEIPNYVFLDDHTVRIG
jgi:ubiquinol-cytochrome c reductase iron-sulfur subunit